MVDKEHKEQSDCLNATIDATEQKHDVWVFPVELPSGKHDGEHYKHFIEGHCK